MWRRLWVSSQSALLNDWKTALAKWLEQDSHTQVIERGLGANDVPGNTHLLRVCADESWWRTLPAELAHWKMRSSMGDASD